MQSSERYRREVDEMDRRNQRRLRVLSFSGAAVVIIAALWAAGLPPSSWWTQLRAWWAPATPASEVPQHVASTPSTAPSAATTSQQPLAGTDSSISATPQPLYLVATSPGRNASEGTAQIGASLENPQTYGGGAQLANGATLREIHRDHVVLARGRDSVRLDLYRPNQPARASNHALLHVGGMPTVASPSSPVFQVAITSYLRPNPVFDGDVLRGYEVYPGPKSGVFHQFGLQGGDVITALNDTPFVDADQAMQSFEPLTQGQSMTATVERKGKTLRITLDSAVIAADEARAQEAAAAQMAAPQGMPPG